MLARSQQTVSATFPEKNQQAFRDFSLNYSKIKIFQNNTIFLLKLFVTICIFLTDFDILLTKLSNTVLMNGKAI
jgi:hypothetical protein